MQQLSMLLLLLALLQIFCSSVVLSLPPSLIANAASGIRLQHLVRQHQQQQQQRAREQQQSGISSSPVSFNRNALWKKDNNANFYDSMAVKGERALESIGMSNDDIRGSSIYNNNNNNNNNNNLLTKSRIMPPSAMAMAADINRGVKIGVDSVVVEDISEDSLESPPFSLLLSSSLQSQSQSPAPPVIAPRVREIEWNKFLPPLKYWTRHCEPNVDDDCPQEYQQYQFQQQAAPLRIADNRNKAAAAALSDNIEDGWDYDSDIDTSLYPNKDVFMLLNGQEDLTKFLHWAMEQLQPNERLKDFTLANGDNIYSTDRHWWKKLNLSGRHEPPLFVEEPHYVIVRREPLVEHKWGYRFKDDPFIPPRGRKHHHIAELEQLLHRYEPFVPNRGKRDKIKDLFKYDDLFFPNRGKKQKPVAAGVPSVDDEPQNESVFNVDVVENNIDDNIAIATAATICDDDDDHYEGNRNRNDADKWTLPPPPLQQAAPPLSTAVLRPSKLWQQKTAAVDGIPSLVANINSGRQHNNNNNRDADEWPQRMSTNAVKINGYDQSVKASMPTTTTKIKTTTGEMSTTAATKQQQPQPQQWQPQKQWQYRQRRIVNADGVAANRLHATRSMSTLEQQQQRHSMMAAVKQWLRSTMFNTSLRQQLLEKLKQQQQEHHLPHRQQQQQQHEAGASISQHPLIMRYLQLLQRNAVTKAGGRQSPQETQLTALDIQQQQQQHQQKQMLPTTFIDGNDDYNYFYNI